MARDTEFGFWLFLAASQKTSFLFTERGLVTVGKQQTVPL